METLSFPGNLYEDCRSGLVFCLWERMPSAVVTVLLRKTRIKGNQDPFPSPGDTKSHPWSDVSNGFLL